ncbi:hypothetical protein DY000_02047007 [Brassica cretica]|uniref:Transposase InsH N-terminal domain-containing protein n=1 Tax=Brassica cretica TaxID=69181 RepID=A0ABQ7F6R8_BRACR|nr:hypothetical protein DY000_02047007 [Brassica cretica]
MNRLRGSKGCRFCVTTTIVKVELSDKNRSSKAKRETCKLDKVGTSCLNMSWFMYIYSLEELVMNSSLTWNKLSVSHGILGARGRLRTLNDMSVSWLFQMVFFSQREGCCRRVEEDRLMRFFAGMDLRERGVTCSRQSSAEQAYERKQMGLQGITVAEDLLATTAVQSDVQGKVLIQIVTKEILRMRSLVSTGY